MLLYTHPLSANAHKVKLLLGYLGLDHDERTIDIPGGEQRGDAFLAISALGQIPVLEDGNVRLRDGQAILIYLAGREGRTDWWPADALGQGLVAQWLAFAAVEQQAGINRSRLNARLGVPCDLDETRAVGERSLGVLDEHLREREWLELGRPTIGDCACAPFAARAGEAGHDLTKFPNIGAWLGRLRALPGFAPMEGWG